MRKNNKGFTLVELLAVIVILGLLMAIAIPSVTKYITQSRVKTLVSTMDGYVTAVVTQVNNGEYKFSDSTKVFAIPIECISLEKGGTNPFGNWYQANSSYWAYVLVHYDSNNYNYEYGFTFKDDAGYGLYPTLNSLIENSMVRTGYDDLNQPKDGKALDFVSIDKWEGFSNITSSTMLEVLVSESEGYEGDGQKTCTLCQKGDNYEQVEQEKDPTFADKNKPDNELPILTAKPNETKYFWKYRETIINVTFEDKINIPADAVNYWDVSSTRNKMVMAYIKRNDKNSSYYDLYIQGDGRIYANSDMSYWFWQFTRLESINNIRILNTSKVTTMKNMFSNSLSYSTSFTMTGLETWDTSNVTDMSYMFYSASGVNVTTWNVTGYGSWDTSNVINMSKMFYNIGSNVSNFTLGDFSNWDTSNVTDMSDMFNNSGKNSDTFRIIGIENWNTSKVTDMSGMFGAAGTDAGTFYIGDLSKWDTSNVTDMSAMFSIAGTEDKTFILTGLDNWNVSKVTTTENMFYRTGYNSSLFSLNISNWDTSSVTDMSSMFYEAGLNSPVFNLDCSKWNVNKVTRRWSFNSGVTSKVIAPKWKN